MHIAYWLVQAIHWVTSFPLRLCQADTDQGGLCFLLIKTIVLILKRDPQTLIQWSQMLLSFQGNPSKGFVVDPTCAVGLTKVDHLMVVKVDNNLKPKFSFLLCNTRVFESFMFNYRKLFIIGQQQKCNADCIELVEYCEKQFCVPQVV